MFRKAERTKNRRLPGRSRERDRAGRRKERLSRALTTTGIFNRWGSHMQAIRSSSMFPSSDVIPAPSARRSLHEAAIAEMQRYKWIESERAGCDLGDRAITTWVRQHWHGFVRRCWLEHLEGRVFWIELDHDDFGMLRHELPDSALMDEIIRRIRTGGENLDILCWSRDRNPSGDELWKVLGILERLDINAHRVECRLDPRLLQAG